MVTQKCPEHTRKILRYSGYNTFITLGNQHTLHVSGNNML